MNVDKMQEIERLMNLYKKDVYFSGKVEEKIINEMEKAIGLKLPIEYKEYVKTFGAGGISGVDIIGIEINAINNKVNTSILTYLEIWRKRGLEEKYIPVMHVDDIVYFVDGTEEDSAVYVYYWGMGTKGIGKCFESFFDFVLDQMANTIDDL